MPPKKIIKRTIIKTNNNVDDIVVVPITKKEDIPVVKNLEPPKKGGKAKKIITKTNVINNTAENVDIVENVNDVTVENVDIVENVNDVDTVENVDDNVVKKNKKVINNDCTKDGSFIMLFNGTNKPIGELIVGDCVIGLDGLPKKISEINKGNSKMYQIEQKNGMKYTVDGTHILVLKFTAVEGIYWSENRKYWKARYVQNFKVHDKCFQHNKKLPFTEEIKKSLYDNANNFLVNKRREIGYNGGGDIIEISVDDYLKLPVNIKTILYGFKQEVDFPIRNVKLDPYMLGLWLGDGTTLAPQITNIDEEIIDYIYDYAKKNNLRITKNKKMGYYITGIQNKSNTFLDALKHYDLIGNKHIPIDYLLNSREIRLQVLAGLIDSDGYMYDNMYEIFQKFDKLGYDLAMLCRSLGFKTRHSKRNKTCVKKDGPNVTKVYNSILLSGKKIDDIPCLLERKKTKPCGKDIDFLITSIRVVGLDVSDYISFKIEGNGKYLGADYTVLHA